MKKNEYLIYGLVDPLTGILRYIGKSSSGLDRPKHHWTHKQCRERNDHCHNWVRQIISFGKIPGIVVIENLGFDLAYQRELDEHEIAWISYFRNLGFSLTNESNGGDGITGPMPLSIREKISKTRKDGKYVSWTKIHGHSEETKKKLSDIAKGRTHSLETKKKMSLSHLRRNAK